ncbi:hypothetical protein QTI17_29560 [Variovorax sp. J31P179]|uniref:hypothetical protein n=1 Tax=Variovorax sp. J31P179 TaxID=3053508 RepID=UPI00257676F2|nr:hypothetical protein [Variovorax sp. J31P179]MDM0084755.1 hypothetical protein [Variovorax sp. J31P179]
MDASIYDSLCARVLNETQASAVMLVVVGGPKGSGYSVQALEALTESCDFAKEAPRLLRELADHLEGTRGGSRGSTH